MTSPRAALIYTAPYHVLQQESGGEVLSCRPLLGKRAPILWAYLAQSFLLFLPPFSQTLFLPAHSSHVQTKATCESSCTCSTVTPESVHGRIQKLISEGANRNVSFSPFPPYLITSWSLEPGVSMGTAQTTSEWAAPVLLAPLQSDVPVLYRN